MNKKSVKKITYFAKVLYNVNVSYKNFKNSNKLV